jgi:hypothetical protein
MRFAIEKKNGNSIVAVSFTPKRLNANEVRAICPILNGKTGYPR